MNLFSLFGFSISLEILLISAFLMLTLRQVVRYIGVVITTKIRERLQKDTKGRMFSKYITSTSNFQDNAQTGDLINIFTIETNKSILGLLTPLEIISNFILTLLYFSMLVLISFDLTFISLIVILSSYFFVKKWISISRLVGNKVVHINSKIGVFLYERLSFGKLIKISVTEKPEKGLFDALTLKQCNLNIYQAILEARTNLTVEPVVIFSSLAFLYFSHTYYQMDIESIGLYFIIVMRLLPVFNSILTLFQRLQRSLGSMKKVNNKLTQIEENKESSNGEKILQDSICKINFDNVGYSICEHDIDIERSLQLLEILDRESLH